MNTKQDITMKLMAYADGELTSSEKVEVETLLAHDPALNAELAEIQSIHAFAFAAFEVPASVKVDVADAVMAKVMPAESGVLARFGKWLGELFRFEHPVALAGLAAAIVALVVGVTMSGGSAPSVQVPAAADSFASSKPGPRRGMEQEHTGAGRNTAFVDAWEVDKGKVAIDVNKDDPDQPMVLWHVIDGEGTSTPKGL